jgi:type 1 fimbriae regulatory protein FimB/type 1 fimbriae regulatory protein FimE
VPDPVRENQKSFERKSQKISLLLCEIKELLTVKKKTIIFPVMLTGRAFPVRKQTANASTRTTENFTVARRYLTEREVERLMDTARKVSRRGHRDATMILVAYRHGLRASEVCGLEWHQVELDQGRLHVRRAKRGTPSVHPIRGDEIRALRKLRRENPTEAHVFVSERGGPISPMGFHHLIARLGKAAKLPFAIHPHMLRHACGFKLANDGHDTRSLQHYLGHKNIQHTVRYTELSPDRFRDFWR